MKVVTLKFSTHYRYSQTQCTCPSLFNIPPSRPSRFAFLTSGSFYTIQVTSQTNCKFFPSRSTHFCRRPNLSLQVFTYTLSTIPLVTHQCVHADCFLFYTSGGLRRRRICYVCGDQLVTHCQLQHACRSSSDLIAISILAFLEFTDC